MIKKHLLTFILLAICGFSLFFFLVRGRTYENTPEKTGENRGERVKLTFWMRAATKHSVTGDLVERYNATNTDNVQVVFNVYGENYKNVVYMALQSGNPPDIFELNAGLTVRQLAEAKYIMPLDAYITEEYKKEFYPTVFSQKHLYYQDKLYAIPERIAYWCLLYNKDLFKKAGLDPDKPPDTLEEMKDYAGIITEAGDGAFYGYGCPLKTTSTFIRFTDNLSSRSGLTGEHAFDWGTGRFDFHKQKPFLEYLMTLDKEGSLYPDPFNLDIEVSRILFGQGKFAMMIDGSWVPATYNNKEVECVVDWDSAPIPIFAGVKRAKGHAWYDMAKLISAKTEYPDQAWRFIKFLLDNQDEFVKKGEPLRTKVSANRPEYFPKEHKGFIGCTDLERNAAFPLMVHYFIDVEENIIYNTYKKIFLGQLDIDKGLRELTVKHNEALDRAIKEGLIQTSDIHIQNFDYYERIGL